MAEIRLKSTGTLKLFENDNTSSVTIASPASLGADRTITLPDADVTLVSGTMSTFDPDGAVTINDSGADVDFRVEDANNENAFFVDGASSAGNPRIGIGVGSGNIDNELHIQGDNPRLQIESTATGADNTGIIFNHAGTEKYEFWHDEDAGAFYFDQSVETDGWGFNFRTFPTGGSDNTVAMKIDGGGIVTKPLSPGFKVTQTGAHTVADGHTLFATNTTEVKDLNADWASGTFTAPVDGMYYFGVTTLYQSVTPSTTTLEDQFVSSNQTETITRNGLLDAAFTSGGYVQSWNSTILFMDASDTVYCKHLAGGTLAVHASAANSHFEGYLLG